MTVLLGLLSVIAVIVASIEGDWRTYVQMHSVILVIGGTLAILFFSTPWMVLKSLGLHLSELLHGDEVVEHYKEDILRLAENRQSTVTQSHPLINYAQELWAQGIDPDLFIVLLSQKRREIDSRGGDAIQAIKNLSKYPPTLGMIGTVMGMITLFAALDQNRSNIGSALSTAMTATFFGLLLANGLISPLADRLHVKHVRKTRLIENVYELLLLINQGEPVVLIREEVNERAA